MSAVDPRDQMIADVEALARSRRVSILFGAREPMGLEVTWLYADRLGEGDGSAVMTRLTELCDRHGVTLTILPADARNEQFYARFGFVTPADDILMVRLPVPSIQVDLTAQRYLLPAAEKPSQETEIQL